MFLAILQVIWHHLQMCQEYTCPPWLLLESWWTYQVLTNLYMSDHREIYTQCCWPSFKSFDTMSKCIMNIHVLQDSSCWVCVGSRLTLSVSAMPGHCTGVTILSVSPGGYPTFIIMCFFSKKCVYFNDLCFLSRYHVYFQWLVFFLKKVCEFSTKCENFQQFVFIFKQCPLRLLL